MIQEVKSNIDNPDVLEKLYREDKKAFRAAFGAVYQETEKSDLLKFWKVRLEYDNTPELLKGLRISEIFIVIGISLFTAFLIKIPALFHLDFSEETFYLRNTAIIVFLGLTIYKIWESKIFDTKKMLFTFSGFLALSVYVNLLPPNGNSASVKLVYIHMPFLLWFIYEAVFSGYDFMSLSKRINFIRYNGDLAIIYALIAIAGGILTAITLGLFNSIGLNIDEFYANNIVISGAAAAPVIGTFLIEKYPTLVNKAAPLIAGIFSPLVLLTLVIFMITIFITGKDPYNDRDFLLIFNLMLLGVMAIIIFSVSETSVIKNQKFNAVILLILSLITIFIDLIALSAIFYRLGEFGLTPNRLAVLVSNFLVLINLIFIMADLFRINFRSGEFKTVEMTVARYLPVYLVWIVIVIFGFPLIFGTV